MSSSPIQPREVNCPYCGSTQTELFALFGQQLLTAQYYCQTCRTPFEHIKDDTVLRPQGGICPQPDYEGKRSHDDNEN